MLNEEWWWLRAVRATPGDCPQDYCIAPPSLERQAVGPMYLFLKVCYRRRPFAAPWRPPIPMQAASHQCRSRSFPACCMLFLRPPSPTDFFGRRHPLALQMLPNNDPNPGKPLFSVARDFLIYEKAMGGIACRESSVLENCYLDTMQTNWLDG